MDSDLELLKMIFENLSDPVFLIDSHGHTVLANSATVNMYKCSRLDYQKNYCDAHAMLAQGTVNTCLVDRVIETKEELRAWNQLIAADQSSELYYYWQKPIFDSYGNVKYVLGTCRLREKMEQEYLESFSKLGNYSRVHLKPETKHKLIYESREMEELIQYLRRVNKTDVNVLLMGETGVGKDVLANYIHDNSPRQERSMVSVNCAAVPPNLFEAELFGYEKGAFTGALHEHPGLIETANRSTLFLDEIDALPLEQQGKLLRALETKVIRRVGSTKHTVVDFRLIAATNKDLQQLVDEGRFRIDLYYRLNVVTVSIPPLRERTDDIRPLAKHFLELSCADYGIRKQLMEPAYRQLEEYSWPGNVRELRNVIERSVLGSEISAQNLDYIQIPNGRESTPRSRPSMAHPPAERTLAELTGAPLKNMLESYEKKLIEDALQNCGNMTRAATNLGISLSSLSRKISQYDIKR